MERIEPCTCMIPDEGQGRLKIEVHLPGVRTEDVKVEMKPDSFCVSAPSGEDQEFSACFNLPHEIESEQAEISFTSGRLNILAPFIKGRESKRLYRPQG